MAGPSDPIREQLFTRQCPKCGSYERCSTCQAEGCGRQFVLAPSGSRILCPRHDPVVDPADLPAHLEAAPRCPKCGERLLEP